MVEAVEMVIIKTWTGTPLYSSPEKKSLGAHLQDAVLQGAHLRGAILRGAHLQDADLQDAHLQDAHLEGAHLEGADLRGAHLRGAILQGAHLQGADLRGAHLQGADLRGAHLQGADLRGAHLPFIPIVEHLDQQILAALDAGGRLEMGAWHGCGTTHCRAGWAITLAGAEGRRLESWLGPSTAGALIYHASAGYIPNFYGSNEDALADIKAHAEATT